MKTFLEYVARDIISKYGDNLSRVAVVFPNKRAALFMNDHLVRMAGRPIWSPAYITISELFRRHSQKKSGDQIKLICDLHKCFTEATGIDETLDHFYGWGQLLLADFDDIDKNMADPKKVFANLRDIHELDDVSYLSPGQVEMIRRFFSNFSEDHNSELKRRFLSLWSHMYDIYCMFNARLAEAGLAYEGALYREVAEDSSIEFEYDTYLFVGFNMLQKVERRLFERLQKDGRARFYWDFDRYYMPDSRNIRNEAGHYIAAYMQHFPNELDTTDSAIYDNFTRKKNITLISAPTENIQARYISRWLTENGRIAAGRRTAVVMCNEGLLQTVIHCLPDEADKVNITTGYPLAQSPVAALLTLLISLQTVGYRATAEKYRLHAVNAVLRHPYIKYVSPLYATLHKALNDDARIYYPARPQLCIDEGMTLLFGGIDGYTCEQFSGRITAWIIDVIRLIASNAGEGDDPLFKEALFRTYTLMNRLSGLIASGDLIIDVVTLQRLVTQLMKATSIPFHGEPVVGVQVMGVLETRNLDFDHLLILSANEGNMPKGVNDTSFIPYSIRKAHDLTTIDNKVAIYAYYFYRLLQRASDITVVYNNSTENGTTGEMSRFILQILVESNHSVARKVLQAEQLTVKTTAEAILKTPHMTDMLRRRFDSAMNAHKAGRPLLTPTAVNKYLRCPKQFYYNYVCGIYEPDNNDTDEIDNRIFGNIFHEASQKMYEQITGGRNHVRKEAIERMLGDRVTLERIVDETFSRELFRTPERTAARPEYNGLQLINREVIITYLKQLLKLDMRLAPFDIIGLETDVVEEMDVCAGSLCFKTTVGGRIDRLDRINDGTGERIRVVDYKTGSRKLDKRDPLVDIPDIFSPENIDKHSDYYLQTFLYSAIVRRNTVINPHGLPVSPALLFIQFAGSDDYDPTLCLNKEPVTDISGHEADIAIQLREKVGEIFNPDIPFRPTADSHICSTCPYRQLCGGSV